MTVSQEVKKCSRCREPKPLTRAYWSSAIGKWRAQCKVCENATKNQRTAMKQAGLGIAVECFQSDPGREARVLAHADRVGREMAAMGIRYRDVTRAHGPNWTACEIDQLLALRRAGVPIPECARHLNRPYSGVERKLRDLRKGIARKVAP